MKDIIKARSTTSQIEAIKAGASRRLVSDEATPNLFLSIEPTGAKSWKYDAANLRAKGRIKMTLGRWPAFGLADAREWAEERNMERARGDDPRKLAELAAAAEKVALGQTIEGMWTEWLAHKRRAKEALRSLAGYDRLARPDFIRANGDKPISQLTKTDVRDTIRVIQDRGSASQANRLLILIKQFLAWASREDYVEYSVAADLVTTKETPVGSRDLSLVELALAYRAAAALTDDERDCVRLLILTGTRKMESCGARSSDFEGGIWTIPLAESVDAAGATFPPSHSKTHREHPQLLPPLARAIFKARTNREYLFHDAPHQWMFPDLSSKLLNAMVELGGKPIKHFTLHGIRKGVASAITSDEMEGFHSFSTYDADIVLNHAVNKITKTYTKSKFANKIGRILAAYEELLQLEIDKQSGANVVAFAV